MLEAYSGFEGLEALEPELERRQDGRVRMRSFLDQVVVDEDIGCAAVRFE